LRIENYTPFRRYRLSGRSCPDWVGFVLKKKPSAKSGPGWAGFVLKKRLSGRSCPDWVGVVLKLKGLNIFLTI